MGNISHGVMRRKIISLQLSEIASILEGIVLLAPSYEDVTHHGRTIVTIHNPSLRYNERKPQNFAHLQFTLEAGISANKKI
jgi:hypothetical protein